MNIAFVLTALCLLLVPLSGYGQTEPEVYESHEEILSAAKQYLLNEISADDSRVKITFNPLDHRLKLTRCESPLETYSTSPGGNKGKTTVEIRCPAPSPWKLYVTAILEFSTPVVVAKRDVSRGAAITEHDVELVTRDTNHLLRGYFESLSQVVGRTLRRSLRRNQVITPGQLIAQKTITRGQMVTILAGDSGIEVRMKGKALQSGNPGELIPVENLSSKKKLEARIVAAGSVRID